MRARYTMSLVMIGLMIGLMIGSILLMPQPAYAHSIQEIDTWEQEWIAQVPLTGLTPDLMWEWIDFHQRHELPKGEPSARKPSLATAPTPPMAPPTPPTPPTPPANTSPPETTAPWASLIGKYFQPADIPWATRVMFCESRNDPNAKNPRSSASGLFQQLATFWPERSAKAGWAGANIFDPEANIAVSAWLYYTGGAGHWECK